MAPHITCACGTCHKCIRRVYMREWYAKNAERHRETAKASQERRREKVREYDRMRYKRDGVRSTPEVRKARQDLRNAVVAGRIIRGPCERETEGTCNGRIEAHHDDYSKPFEVRWLCRKHHGEEHRIY